MRRRSFWMLLPLFSAVLTPTGAWEASVSQNLSITVTTAPTVTINMASPSSLSVQPGGTITYTTNWNGGPTASSYEIFTHFTDTSGNILFQDDVFPNPLTTSWSSSPYTETRTVTVPSTIAPGTYNIMAGLYSGATRLTLNPGPGVTADDQTRYNVGTLTVTAATQPAFYVATNGSDSNPGTLAAPFATLTKCQSAMRNSSTVKTCYLRAGTYQPASIASCWWGANQSCGISLTSSDNGETWATYPPDGCDNAIINGQSTADGNGLYVIFSGNGATNVTWNCLTMKRFQFASISVVVNYGNSPGPAGMVVTQNIIMNGTEAVGAGGASNQAGIQCFNCTGMVISHNAIHDIAGFGLSVSTGITGATINNLSVTGNNIYDTCTATADCGAIYTEDRFSALSTGVTITNNFIRDGNTYAGLGSNAGQGIYLDECSSNMTISGNVVTGRNGSNTLMNNGGANNTWSGNIVDLTGYAQNIAAYQTISGAGDACDSGPQTGNKYVNNVIIGAGGGGGYFGYLPVPYAQPIIGGSGQANDYYNHAGSAISSSGIYTVTANDALPQRVAPQISGCYVIAGGSPVLSSPINLPPLVGGWGPPGWVIPPASGSSVPSYPSPTC
jgi:Right handed beta helix region